MTSTVTPLPEHPAKFSAEVLAVLQRLVSDEATRLARPPVILDPFAGVGRIHDLVGCITIGVELEPEWAACRHGTYVGDATNLVDHEDGQYDAVMTSPCYGNRLADHHNAKDGSRRMSYRTSLGRPPTEGSAAVMHWGDAYRELHLRAIAEFVRVVRPGGLVVVNMSNHVRKREVQRVVEWWTVALLTRGLLLERVIPVATPRMRFGQNHAARTSHELVIVTRRPS